MATKISALPAGSALGGTEEIPCVQGGATVGVTAAQVKTYVGGITRYTANVGDGTNVSYTLNHAIGTRDVHVTVYRNATPYDEVIVDVQHTDANNVTLVFSTAPATNQFRAVIWG